MQVVISLKKMKLKLQRLMRIIKSHLFIYGVTIKVLPLRHAMKIDFKDLLAKSIVQ